MLIEVIYEEIRVFVFKGFSGGDNIGDSYNRYFFDSFYFVDRYLIKLYICMIIYIVINV